MLDVPLGSATFLFSDIESSTKLWHAQTDGMRDVIARHDALLREANKGRAGTMVKKVGDGVGVVSPQPVSVGDSPPRPDARAAFLAGTPEGSPP